MKRYINDVLTKILTLTLLLLAGANTAWGETDYSGTWYIKSFNSYNPNFTPTYYMVPTINCFYNSDEDKPHLTTFKTEGDKNSIWRFVKVVDDDKTYYRIIHNATGKYLVVNDAVPELAVSSQKQAHRKRVHLETLTTPGEESLFILVEPGDITGVIGIRHKSRGSSTTGDGIDHYYLNPQNGNKDYYRAANGLAVTNYQGIIGFYGKSVPSSGTDGTDSRWKLYDANNTCANPVIQYNDAGTNIKIFYPISDDTGWTIYYTTDGSDPRVNTSQRHEITATETITDLTGVTKVRAIATKTGWETSDESVLIASGVTQLVQSKECDAFYMVPPIVDGDLIYATTTNIPNAKMGWNFVPAGLFCGIQYYNIINAETGEYLYCSVGSNTNNALIMKPSSEIIVDDYNQTIDRAKFRLILQDDGSYKLIAKWWAAENPAATDSKFYYITKNGGNNNANAISTSFGTDNKSQWNVFAAPIAPINPKEQFDASFATTTESQYYIIKSANSSTYHLLPPATVGGNATANTTEANQEWTFIPIDDNDTWTPYYLIQNGSTGEYLYFNGVAGTNNNNTFFTSNAIETGQEDIYKFIVVKGANGDYPNSYNIIPKALKNQAKQELNSLFRNNDKTLRTHNSRAQAASLWQFEEKTTFVAPATITFSADDMKVYMNSTTINASKVIRYNVSYDNADAPGAPISTSTLYDAENGLTISYGPIYKFNAKTFVGENSSASTAETIDLSLVDPTIEDNNDGVTFYTTQKGVSFCYTTDENQTPSYTDASNYTGTLVASDANGSCHVSLSEGEYTIKVIAVNTVDGTVYSTTHPVLRVIDLRVANTIDSYADISSPTARYKLSKDFVANESQRVKIDGKTIGSIDLPFKGTIEGYIDETTGEIKPISLSKPLFDYVENATIKNIIVAQGTISATENGSGNVGAIAGNALGKTRIYNCGVLGSIKGTKDKTTGEVTYTYGSEISGSADVGSIVGLLSGTSRVINCFSFAKITGGTTKGGIVGNNNYASKSGDIKTMVMNCMFYGDITGGGSPVYGGNNINNLRTTGLNTYNYYRYESYYSKKKQIGNNNYHCALAMKEQYLTRFEIYRQLLNSNRKLAAWYATGEANKGLGENNEMAKWVLDKSIAPYPILKKQGYYPSVVNYDPNKTFNSAGAKVSRDDITVRSQGGYIKENGVAQELEVNISLGSGAPTGASIKTGKEQISLKRIDKDTLNYNFNYDKVQLPYFNEVGDGNYTGKKVVTGWKITLLSGGTAGDFTTGADIGTDGKTPYNFADRNCTNKDNFSVSGRVFSQGAYFDVPYGVTSINIEPYWGHAAYISDPYYDVVYDNKYANPTNVEDMGAQGNSLLASGQTIYSTVSSALNSLPTVSNATVYDYALVLVGNLHLTSVPSTGSTPFTIMSADLDKDNEPDYSLIYSHPGRSFGEVSPIRFDFVNVPGTAMAQKPNGASLFRNVSIFKPKGWFEITNTCQISIVQFEYDNGGKSSGTLRPVIFLGGEFEQIVSTQNSTISTGTHYIHVGSNAYFKEFNNGTHSDGFQFTPHIPISATGGDYDKFYLSGAYRPDAIVGEDDAEGYISGGRFGEVAGAGQQMIDGNVYWQIYDADIREFYGGGINSDKPITGNIVTDIYNSHVKTYCGGPKFGDMQKQGSISLTYPTGTGVNITGSTTREKNIDKDRTVTTTATGCTFTNYYGAGYGGIAYVRKRTQDDTSSDFTNWQKNYTDNKGLFFDGSTKIGDGTKGEMAGPGVAVDFDYEFFVWSTGETGGRFYNKYASLSFATTNNVESTLTNCIIKENFYGGGNLGKVDGTIKSTLNGCSVAGNVFGAGFSAQKPTVPYRDGGFTSDGVPSVDTNAGVFADGVKSTNIINLTLTPGTLTNNTTAITATTITTDFTSTELDNLGTVSGKVTLNIGGNTVVEGKTFVTDKDGNVIVDASGNRTVKEQIGGVFGGGDASAALSDTEVNIQATGLKYGYTYNINNVYGGGNKADVSGSSKVTLAGNTDVRGNVFGGGNDGEVGGSARVNIVETLPTTNNSGN